MNTKHSWIGTRISLSALALLAGLLVVGCSVPDVTYPEPDAKAHWQGGGFVRYSGHGTVAGTLQIAATTLRKEGSATEIQLLGAVHVADEAYYDALQETMDRADLVLFELVKPEAFDTAEMVPTSGGLYGELADTFGLSEQMALIDYRRPNFRWLDMTHEEFSHRAQVIIAKATKRVNKALGRENGGGSLGQAILNSPPEVQRACAALAMQMYAVDSPNPLICAGDPVFGTIQFIMRAALVPLKAEKHYYATFKTEKAFEDKYKHMLAAGLCQQQENMFGQFAALRGSSELTDAIIDALEEFGDLLVNQRNDVVIDGINEILADNPPEHIVVFYGAGHFQDMSAKLDAQGWKPAKKRRWYSAIEIQE